MKLHAISKKLSEIYILLIRSGNITILLSRSSNPRRLHVRKFHICDNIHKNKLFLGV